MGDIQVQLFEQEAPVSSENFLEYVDKGFYDGTIFHRVIPGFMVQGGGYTADLQRKATMPPIKNEADRGLKNDKYTLAMARTSDPDSATSQFFINTSDNAFLNQDQCQDGVGYAVFGKVIEGTEVVDQIAAVKTGTVSGMQDVPLESVLIETISRA